MGVVAAAAPDEVVVAPRVLTPSIHGYDEAPRTPDSDDPAIWVNPRRHGEGLVIGALKDAGLQVYDLQGNVLQTIISAYRPPVSVGNPPVPGAQPDPGTTACPDSASGRTFGRFNNVDAAYDVPVRFKHGVRKLDIAVVTDRGCDRLRIFAIKPGTPGGPLVEITAPNVARVFPQRFIQPSPFYSPGEPSAVVDNDLDDQSTAYGLTLYKPKGNSSVRVVTTQRRRAVVAELELFSPGNGKLSYRRVREYRFDPVFRLPAASGGSLRWSPCREEAAEDPQFEGLVVDKELGILYAAQEMVGVWRIVLDDKLPRVVTVPPSRLWERVRSFGVPYFAVPDGDEYSCETEAPQQPVASTVAVSGNPAAAGAFIEADVEGLAIYYGKRRGSGYLLISSQGDDTFHVYDRTNRREPALHLASFKIENTGETDGHEVVNVPVGADFPFGLFVSQNGKAPGPDSEVPINGYEYDNSTQFELLGWEDIATPLGLLIEEKGFDPRKE